jgi:hypothetical protein
MNYPFDTVGLNSETIDRFDDTCKAIKAKYNFQPTGHIDFHLENFEVFRRYIDVTIRDSFVIKHTNNDCYTLFTDNHSRIMGPSKGGGIIDRYDYQTWALAYLKKDFGRVMIRRETLTDKILELIHPIELDFAEDKAFSDTFYVLVNDRQKAISAIDRNFRNAVMDIRGSDFVIEIVNHTLIIGNKNGDPVPPEEALQLAEFVVRICSLC